MAIESKSLFIIQKLEELFPNPSIPLIHKDPYTLLVAVLLSARCTDDRVNKVTPILFSLADNPYKMSRLKVEKIREIIKSCGLSPKKSLAISNLSKILLKKHNSIVPNNFNDLENLPGVGHKTASVVLAQAFKVPTFPLDTHIHRLSYRWLISNGKSVVQTEKDCKLFFPKEKWNKLHLQIIYFGREYCQARKHSPNDCPICSIVGRKSMFN